MCVCVCGRGDLFSNIIAGLTRPPTCCHSPFCISLSLSLSHSFDPYLLSRISVGWEVWGESHGGQRYRDKGVWVQIRKRHYRLENT